MRSVLLATGCMVLSIGASSGAHAGSYTYTAISLPNERSSSINGINAAGVAVGDFTDTAGVSHGFIRAADGTVTVVDVPGYRNAALGRINAGGTAAGIASNFSGGASAGVAFSRDPVSGAITLKPTKLAAYSVDAINDAGSLAIYVATAKGFPAEVLFTKKPSYISKPKQMKVGPVALLADNSIIGNQSSNVDFGVTWANGVVTKVTFPGIPMPSITTVAADGTIGGKTNSATDPFELYLAAPSGTVTIFSVPNAQNIRGLTSSGDVIGETAVLRQTGECCDFHGYLYRSGAVSEVSFKDGGGTHNTEIVTVTANGTFGGYFNDLTPDVNGNYPNHAFIAICPAGQAPCTP